MIGTEQNYCECLYLHKDNENEIYVNNSQNLKQHQIDSLRFLYRQFIKKKLGAVLNFPPGSGKSLVVTLFLNAVSALLKERVLILCSDDEEIDNWKQMFSTWTIYESDEIAVESSNPRVKKKIFLKKAENLASYLRWHWSVVVIKDDMCKALQKVVLDADLKIWITSTDVKKDLSLLLFIYNWMFPKSNVNVNEILSSQDNPRDTLVQSIIIDTFLNDFVIRENKLKVIKETKNSQMVKTYRHNTQTATMRKNKDVTGTKVKKSKQTLNNITPMIQTNTLPIRTISEDIKEERHSENSNDSIVVTKINDKYVNRDNNIKQVQVNNDHSNLEINQNALKMENSEESLDFKNAINDIVLNENNACVVEDSTESLEFGDDTESIIDNKNVINTQSVDNNMDFDTSITTDKSEHDLDYKMSELEERTMKKFKGSLLDNLF